MKKEMLGVLGLSLGLGLSAPVFAHENEHERGQTVKMDDLPAAARTTFEKEAKGGKVEELRKETRKDGTIVYFGEIVPQGRHDRLLRRDREPGQGDRPQGLRHGEGAPSRQDPRREQREGRAREGDTGALTGPLTLHATPRAPHSQWGRGCVP